MIEEVLASKKDILGQDVGWKEGNMNVGQGKSRRSEYKTGTVDRHQATGKGFWQHTAAWASARASKGGQEFISRKCTLTNMENSSLLEFGVLEESFCQKGRK